MNKKTNNKLVLLALLIILAIIAIFFFKNNFSKPQLVGEIDNQSLKVHYIDVGQGDAMLVQYNGKNMLIDSGSKSSSDKILTYLDDLNIKTIDIVVATHPNEDHMGNMAAIVKKYSVLSFYAPKVTVNQYFFESLVTELNNKKLKITPVYAGSSINFDPNIKISVFWPEENKTYTNLNDYCIVMSLKYGNNSFLFTGDVESANEKKILQYGYDVEADVLKVAHHGSKTSSSKEFLDAVNGKYAIIEVGLNNPYGHPSKTTIDELTSRGYKIYRTDLNGSIVVTSNGNTIKISTNK
ncbi:MAG: MBL fold metallo-hydrolase [Oscillospiraceae bacterium]|nr:MBL fold metallo-hydrolase [Oscillospiraceae bacterium]